MRKDFYRFTLKQLALLLLVVCILLGFASRYVRPVYEERAARVAFQKLQLAESDLQAAIKSNNLALARSAIDRGVRPTLGFLQGRGELLKVCIDTCQPEMLALLLERGADPRQSLPADVVGDGPILFAVASSPQSLEIRRKMLDVLLKHGVDINTVSSNQRTVMDIAVYRNEAPLCDLLREYGVPYGPREMVVFNRLAELKEAVADNPKLVHERFAPIYAGQDPTLLGLALSHGHSEVARFLIDSGAPLDTVEQLGQTLMHMAARGGNPDLVRLLAERGLDVNARDDWNDTPLTDSIHRMNAETVKALIEVGADVNAQGVRGHTALRAVLPGANSERYEIIRMLIAAGADPTIADDEGVSTLDAAHGYPREVQTLLGKPTAAAARVE
jgi:ankyrin repeat protein